MIFVEVKLYRRQFDQNNEITMRKIVVIFSLFCISSRLRHVSAGAETKDPYVLAEYDDKDPEENRRYEVPTCAVEDKSKHEIYYSASGESFRILYACYPVPMDDCAMESGNFRNNYCLFDEKPKCGVEGNYEYVIKYVLDGDGHKISCAAEDDNAELYRAGYDFKFADGDFANVDIYRFCYDKTTEKTLYVEYKIISPNLLGTNVDNMNYSREIETSSFDRVDLGDFLKKKAYFETIKDDPEFSSKARNFVVPTEHMALDWWKAPLYHIINQQLLRDELHTYMNAINGLIREKAKTIMGEIFIRAGVFDPSDDSTRDHVWWKLIYNETRTHAIGLIIHDATKAPKKRLCGHRFLCEEKGWKELVSYKMRDSIYCCTPDYLVKKFGFTSVETLDLGKLPQTAYVGEKKDCKIPIPLKPGLQNGPLNEGEHVGGYLSTMMIKAN